MQGQCLCGAVTLITAETETVEICHCGMCRRWGGGPFMAVHCRDGVAIRGEENITRYDSSDWAQRGFCKVCGTHLFYLLKPAQEYVLTAGLFQDQAFTLKTQIFIDKKPDFYQFANATSELTEQQVFDKFS